MQEEERRISGVQKDLKKKKEYYLREHRGRRRRFSASSVVEKASDGFLFPQARECPHRRCPDMLQSTLVYDCVQDLTPGSIRVLVVLLPPPPTTTTHVPLCEAQNALHHRQTTALASVSLWPLQQVVVPRGMTPLPQRKESKTAKDTRAKIPKIPKSSEDRVLRGDVQGFEDGIRELGRCRRVELQKGRNTQRFSVSKGRRRGVVGTRVEREIYDTERHKAQLESALEFVLAGIVVAIAGGRPE